MIPYNTLVVLVGVGLLGTAAGLVGTFATLRRRALVGDALAHAALPGLCVAFLVIGERWLPGLLLGALLSGLLGVGVIAFLRRFTRIKEDAAIGIVLSVFFGLGIVLSQMIQKQTTTGSKAGLDSYILGKTAGIVLADVQLIAGVSLLALLTLLLLYKEAKLLIFDPDFARVQGWPVVLIDFILMGLLAVVVVIGLPAVGVVLMAALLILPGSAARFWSERFGVVLTLAALFGLAMGVVGALLSAAAENLPTGPVIVLVGATIFLVSALFAPRRGLVARLIERRRPLEEPE
jgi:manganese/zinc/iron transport system permease protein